MNRQQTADLIARLHFQHGLARPASADEIDEWHRALDRHPADVAFAVLDHLRDTETKAPTLARLLAEIRAHRPADVARPIGTADCGMCDGTGFMLTRDPNEPGVDRYAPCSICRPTDHDKTRRNRHPATPEPHYPILDGADERRAAWRADRGHRTTRIGRYTPRNRFRDDSTPPASVIAAGLALIRAGDPDGIDVALDDWITAGRPTDATGLAGYDLVSNILTRQPAGDTYAAVLRRQYPNGPGMTDDEIRRRMAAIRPLPGYGANRDPEPPTAS